MLETECSYRETICKYHGDTTRQVNRSVGFPQETPPPLALNEKVSRICDDLSNFVVVDEQLYPSRFMGSGEKNVVAKGYKTIRRAGKVSADYIVNHKCPICSTITLPQFTSMDSVVGLEV